MIRACPQDPGTEYPLHYQDTLKIQEKYEIFKIIYKIINQNYLYAIDQERRYSILSGICFKFVPTSIVIPKQSAGLYLHINVFIGVEKPVCKKLIPNVAFLEY